MDNNSPIQALFSLNSEAMHAFESGFYDEATFKLSQTLSLVRRIIATRQELGFKDENNRNSTGMLKVQSSILCRKIDTTFGEMNLSSSPFFSCHNWRQESPQNPLFHLPLSLPKNEMSLDMFAFVTLYNLALFTHLSSIECGMSRHELKKALKLWELVYSVQWKEELSELSYVHTLAILTNLGHVNKLLGNEASSNHCYQRVLTTLELLRDQGGDSKVEFHTFFLHTALRMLCYQHAAAAAA
jgi:hypothetical protein